MGSNDNIPGANPSPAGQPNPLPTPFNGNRASPEEFGSGAGDELKAQGHQEQQVSTALQERHNFAVDEAAITQAYGLVADKIRNPQTGFASLRGNDALQKLGETRQDFADSMSQIRAGLSEAQGKRIGYRLDRIEKDGVYDAESWAKQQGNVAGEAAFRGAELAAGDRLAQKAGDPTTSVESLQETLRDLAATGVSRAKFRYGESASPDAIQGEVISTVGNAVPKAMSEAIAAATEAGDPSHAQKALDLFEKYLGVHARLATATVARMTTQKTVTDAAENIIGTEMRNPDTAVALPGGGVVARLNPDRIAAAVRAIPPGPNREAIVEAINKRVKSVQEGWKATVEQQVSLAEQEGDPGHVGKFSMDDLHHANPQRQEWLFSHDEKALRALAASSDTAASRQAIQTSREVSSFVESQIVDKANRRKLLETSPEAFRKMLLDGTDFEGTELDAPIIGPHRSHLVSVYTQARKDAGANQLDEKPSVTVHDAITRAADFDPDKIKDLSSSYYNALLDKANTFIGQHKGAVDTPTLAKYVDQELAKGSIPHTGFIFRDKMRRIEAQSRAVEYQGKSFEPDTPAGGEAELLQPGNVERETPPDHSAAPGGAGTLKSSTTIPANLPPPSKPPSAPPAGRVWMRKGTTWGSVPEGQQDAAKKQGYSLE